MPGRQGVSAATVADASPLARRVAALCQREPAAPHRRRAPELVSRPDRPGAALLRARRRLAAEGGFGLVEAMVALTVLAIGGLMLLAQLDASANLSARGLQRDTQAETVAAVRAHVDGALAQAASVGLADESGAGIDALTTAGDQLIYETPDAPAQARCRRLYYLVAERELREAVAPSCSAIRPARGPNETANTAPDPVLDGSHPSAVIAAHLTLGDGPLISYLGANDAPWPVDAQAHASGDHREFYADGTNRSRVLAVRLDFIADARASGGAQAPVARASVRRTVRGGA